ncbi:unnamed protein product [Cuscuta epithymum]|uniref:Uncharacterized protein n=1 Tax=Cuscuta epithymum TaxID=186058 RepID=A0AAV0C0F8_9ASTE|nr:unnamed protein product [Cuscuta epithymum]
MPQQSSSLSFPPAAGCDCSSSSLSSEEGTTAATALLSTAPANFAQSVGNSDKLNSNNGVIATLPTENWNKNSSINGLGTQMPLAILEKWLLDDAYYSVQPEGINHNHGDELLMEAIGMGTSTDPAPGFF